MTTFYEKDGIVTCKIDNKTIIVEWKHLENDQIVKESCLAQLNEVQNGAEVIIVDTLISDGVLSQETQQWLESELFPQLQTAGLRAIITILPQRALTKMTAQRWVKNGATFNFDNITTYSIEDALDLVKSKY